MSAVLTGTCLDGLVGLSRSTCDCFEVPEWATESSSGIYIDELEKLNLAVIDASKDCGNDNIYEMMAKARYNAITAFRTDFARDLTKNYNVIRKSWRGRIGQNAKRSDVPLIAGMAGIKLYPAPLRYGTIKVLRVGSLVNTTGVVPIKIFNSYDPTIIIDTINVNAVANQLIWQEPSDVIELDMYDDNIDCIQYFIGYDVAGFLPKNSKIHCGCGGYKLQYNCCGGLDSFRGRVSEKDRWAQFVNIGGINAADADGIFQRKFSTYNYGVFVELEISCGGMRTICDQINFTEDAVGMNAAYAIAYKTASNLADMIINTNGVNRFTLMDKEGWYAVKNSYQRQYVERINWLIDPRNANMSDSGCYACKPLSKFFTRIS